MAPSLDDVLLIGNGAIVGSTGLAFLATPRLSEKICFKKPISESFGTDGIAATGIAMMQLGARDLVLGLNKDAKSKTKKNALKINGLALLAWSSYNGCLVHRDICKEEFCIPTGILYGAMGVASLVQGFRKTPKPAPPPVKPAVAAVTKKGLW